MISMNDDRIHTGLEPDCSGKQAQDLRGHLNLDSGAIFDKMTKGYTKIKEENPIALIVHFIIKGGSNMRHPTSACRSQTISTFCLMITASLLRYQQLCLVVSVFPEIEPGMD
jgi:hypothetical protein